MATTELDAVLSTETGKGLGTAQANRCLDRIEGVVTHTSRWVADLHEGGCADVGLSRAELALIRLDGKREPCGCGTTFHLSTAKATHREEAPHLLGDFRWPCAVLNAANVQLSNRSRARVNHNQATKSLLFEHEIGTPTRP